MDGRAAERFIQLYLGELLQDPNPLIRLRNTQSEDLDYVLAAEQHPENRAFVFQWTLQQHLDALTNPDLGHLIVERAAEPVGKPVSEPNSDSHSPLAGPAPVGYVILSGLQNANQSINLGRIVITEKGKGYGKAAIEQVKWLAFQTYQAHRLWLDVKVGNERAQAIYKSAGFQVEGTLRDCLKSATGYESLLVMSILRSEYEALSV